jgi:ATP-binding cassette subfamily B protein
MKASNGINAVKWLFQPLKGSKVLYVGVLLIISLVEAAMPIVAAFVYIDIFNATLSKDMDLLIRGTMLFLISLLAAIIILPIAKFQYSIIVKKMMNLIRQDIFGAIIHTTQSEIDSKHSGDILSRATNDLNKLEEIYTNHFRVISQAIVYCLGSIVTMIILDWRFSIVLTILCIISVYIITKNYQIMYSIGRVIQEKLGDLTQRFIDTISGLQVIKLYHMQDKIIGRYETENSQYSKSIIKQGVILGRLDSWTYFLNFLNYTGVIAIGIFFILIGQMEFGVLIAFAQLQWNMSQSFLLLGNTFVAFNASLISYERITNILSFHREDITQSKITPMSFPVSLKEVSYQIGEIEILSGINLDLTPGKRIALVGESGSGKSTLIKLLAGLYSPTGGQLISNGDQLGLDLLALHRSDSAYLSQEPFIFNGTVYTNILYGNYGASRDQVEQAARLALAHVFIMSLPQGYETIINEQGKNLSGGQKQRIALSRLFLKDSVLMLFDEATSALDAELDEQIQQTITNVGLKKCIIQSTHHMETICEYDEILVLHRGQIIERGTHQQLIQRSGKYKEMYETEYQIGVKHV